MTNEISSVDATSKTDRLLDLKVPNWKTKEPPLTTREAAQLLGLQPCTLEKWRYEGNGPRSIKVGSRTVRYRREDLEVFVTQRTNAAQ